MLDVLLIDDNPADVDYTREVLDDWQVEHRLDVALDGERGLERLRAGVPPGLVLLDLNLPRVSGVAVLAAIRAADALCDVPVIVLTTSEAERDVVETHRLHADGFITKPINIEELEFLYYRVIRRRGTP